MNRSFLKVFTILAISLIQISPALSQYGPFYSKERNLKDYSLYHDYNETVKKYNQDRLIGKALVQIDSLANIAYSKKDFVQYLFLKNEVSNFYKFDNKFSEGFLDLHQAMKFYASKCDTINIEYAVSLRMLRGLLTRSGQKSRGEAEMLASQLAILEKLEIDGEPMTNTLVDYGLFLNRQGKRDESIEMLYRARTVALANNDLNSLAVSDYTLISLLDGIDMEETIIDVLANDLLLLKQAQVNIPTLVYISFFNYMLGNRLYWNMSNIEKSVEYLLKTTACLDTLQYPMWNLKSSSHSLLAQCYSDIQDIPNFWHHFQIAKQIANAQPMSSYNRGLAYITLVESAIIIAPDSSQVVLDILKNHEAVHHFQERIIKSQALIHLQKGLITQAIETVNSQFTDFEQFDNIQIPVLSDSIDFQIQLEFLKILNTGLERLAAQKPVSSHRDAINNLIGKQNQLYIGIVQKEVFGHEISSIISEYYKFITQSLSHVLKDYNAAKDQELAASLFFSSKAIQLNNNLGKSFIQGQMENDTTNFQNLLLAMGKVQQTKTELANDHINNTERNHLNRKLNSSLIDMLLQKHKLSQKLSTSYRAIEIPTLAEVQNLLDAKKGIIEFFHDENTLSWILVTKDKVNVGQKVVNDLSKKISAALYEVKTGGKSSNLGSNLFTAETKKIINTLSELVIVPSKELAYIPFEWLSLSSSKKLVETHAISYSYSTSLWYRTRANDNRVDKPTILSLAPLFTQDVTNQMVSTWAYDYRGSSPLPPLPSSRDEVEAISNLFKGNRINSAALIGNHANGTELESLLGKFDILHLATHGHINRTNPERSGLYLYPNNQHDAEGYNPDNDFLSLGKLHNLRINANLAVLSACNSGTGSVAEGEGVMALPRGFIYAGVPNVIASLWKVHDEKTKELMVAFYKYLLSGNSYAEALRLAKQECIAKGFLPIDWAGFVLIGG